jgi:plasmid stability protein
MTDIIVRNVDERVAQALDERAAAAGLRREAWLREQLAALAQGSIVRRTYALRAFSTTPEGSTLQIARHVDGTVEVVKATSLTPGQRGAMQVVKGLMVRNEPGDREAATALLKKEYEQVFETAV